MARLERDSWGTDNLNPRTCVQVDENGHAQYMVMTDDGRWVPAEEW